MSAGLKPYPAYKDSGLEWLGQVPTHWEVRRLGAIGRLFKGNGGTKEDEVPTGVPCVRYGDIYMHHRFFVRESRACVPVERASDYTPVRYGDVLFAGSGETIEEIGKSVACLIESSACCGGDVIVFRPSVELDARFMGYATDSKPAVAQKSRMGRGITVMHIYADQLRNLWLAYPPLGEQAAIVRYLDYMDRRIRRYIRAKQKLIKLLEEHKQVIIHQAVTGQIDVRTGKPYPAYKDSGVESFGQVPEHWSVRRLKHSLRRSVGGSTPKSGDARCWGGNIVWVTPGDVSRASRLRDSLQHITAEGLASCSAELVPSGSIILTSRAPVGNVALAQVRLSTNQGCKALVANEAVISPLFALSLLNTLKSELQSLAVGTTFAEISTSRLGAVPALLPPLPEQTAIVRYLDDATANTDSAIAHAKREIDLLREYRTRLIADVVTGKLDVREAAARLPGDEGDAERDGDDVFPDEGGADRGDEELDSAAREAMV